ncbi:MAG: Bifunctional purine biosynthesis protein PurH [Phycisphaerales bacterium]|nr:Bifunctional purine biosynthesis protein PurH [Phycisphaerales bacterium]
MTTHQNRQPPNIVPVRRALLSVSDKTGLVEFAKALADMGAELISTGGTAKVLEAAGLRVRTIESITGFPEMMDGRVKTLHPVIHGGLLAVRDNPDHAAALRDHSISPIDLVCINLYPFERTVSRPETTLAEAIENIDIGGPSMIRSAAKNADYVTVVTAPDQYAGVIDALRASGGSSTLDLRRLLAARAFALTASYDTLIAAYLQRACNPAPSVPATIHEPPADAPSALPTGVSLSLVLAQPLRYGENPHQAAGLYSVAVGSSLDLGSGIPQARQLHGKELSYNNINDAAAALSLAGALVPLAPQTPAVAACVIKHANPCGAAIHTTTKAAIEHAIASDPVAAYGGILAVTGQIDLLAAERLCERDIFIEVLIAPDYDPAALERLRSRWANMRILTVEAAAYAARPSLELRSVPGGVLVQQHDHRLASFAEIHHAAGPQPGLEQLAAARFLEPVCRALTSNAVCIGGHVPNERPAMRLFGAGAGQMDRVAACRLAVLKAGPLAAGAVAFSDAFFPFCDGPKALIDAGVSCLVHPGGSKRDQETFDLCNELGVTCLVTGIRHFRH